MADRNLRSVIGRRAFILLVGLLAVGFVVVASTASAAGEGLAGFQEPRPGETPATTMPLGAVAVPSELREVPPGAFENEKPVAPGEDPEPLNLPQPPVGTVPAVTDKPTPPPHEPPGEMSDAFTLAGCVGNCYQSDWAWWTDHPNDVYALDYWFWLRTPQNNEGVCQGESGCFWFASNWTYTAADSGMHIGPRRGLSASGNTQGHWRTTISGYDQGTHVGGQSNVNLPLQKWVRARLWRTNHGTIGGRPWANWGVWAMWDGNEQYLGSLTLTGHWMTNSQMFTELYETNGQCQTDFVQVYFNDGVYWSSSQGAKSFPDATAGYEPNCNNTSWASHGGDYFSDGRERPRTIPHNNPIY